MSILLKDSFLSLQNDISRLSVAKADGGGKVARKLLPVEAGLNDVVRATIKTAEPLLFDAEKKCRPMVQLY